jgi:hypothetical protein
MFGESCQTSTMLWDKLCIIASEIFVMSLWLSVATEIVLTAGIIHHIFFDPSFAENQPCMAPRSQ